MLKAHNKLVIAFISILAAAVLLVGAAAAGFMFIVARTGTMDLNRERVYKVYELERLLFDQQRLLAGSIIAADGGKKEEFMQLNNSVKAGIESLRSRSSELAGADAAELEKLNTLNEKYLELFNTGILPGIAEADKSGLNELFKASGSSLGDVLEAEEKLKDAVSTRLENNTKALAAEMAQLRNTAGTAASEAGGVMDGFKLLESKVESLKAEDGERQGENGSVNEADPVEGLKAELDAFGAKAATALAGAALTAEKASRIRLDNIQRDLLALNATNELLYRTQKKYSDFAGAMAGQDYTLKSYNESKAAEDECAGAIEGLLPRADKKLLEDVTAANAALDKNVEASAAELNRIIGSDLANRFKTSNEVVDQLKAGTIKLEDSFKTYLANDIHQSDDIKKAIFGALMLIALISLAIGVFLARSLSGIVASIKGMARQLGKAENGDLTVRSGVRRKDEIGELGEKVDKVLESQQKMVLQVVETTRDIDALKKKLAEIFSTSRDSVQKISSGVRDVVENARQVFPHGEGDISGAGGLASGARLVSESTEKVVNDGMKAIEIAFAGEKSVREAEQLIVRVTDTVRLIAASIQELNDSSGKIGDITNTITDIASKTNLLALNAAIEAARAGQQGKGFTVLADEIRKLSDGSNKAAGEIKTLIADIQKRVQYAVENIHEGVQGVGEGVTKINLVKASIEDIIESVRFVVEAVKMTAKTAYAQTNSVEELAATLGSISRTASETVAAGEDIGRNIERQRYVIEEMEALSRKLDEASGRLGDILERYGVN